MAASGFTPIQLYYSTTNGATPLAGNLAFGELAVNAYNGKLYYKNSNTGLVSILADGAISTGNLPGGSTGTVVYQSSAGVTAYLPIGGASSLLYSNGTLPAYSATGAAGSIVYSTGTAPAYASIGAVGSIVYSNGTAPTSLPIGATDYVLTSTGTVPQFVSQSSLSVGSAATAGFATNAGAATTATTATTASNLAGGSANRIAYQASTNNTTFIAAPTTSGTVLGWTGSALDWVSAPAATTTANIAGGAQYQIPFQSGVSTTTFSSNLTFNSSTNTVGTTNVTATGAINGATVTATGAVSGNTVVATTSVTGATVVANKAIAPTATSGAFSYGTLAYSDTNIFESSTTSVNSYAQKILQNTNNGSTASVDYIVSNDQSTGTTYYGDFGMNSSGFSGVGPFQLPNAVYLYSTSSDLVIGTKTAHYLRLVTNDNSADSMTISPVGAVAFNGDYGVAGKVLGSNGTAGAPTWVDAGGAPSFLLINAGVS